MLRSPLAFCLLTAAALAPAAETASSRLVREVGDAYLEVLTRENPTRRLKLGLPIEKLQDVTLAGEEAAAREGEALLRRLEPVKADELSHEESLSLDVLRRQLSNRVKAPSLFYFGFQVTPYSSPLSQVGQVFAALPLATAADRDRYLARLAEVPAMADAIVANIGAQSAKGIRVPQPELDQVDALLKAFSGVGASSPFRPAASRLSALAEADRAAFLKVVDDRVATAVAPAIGRVAAAVSGDYRAKAPDTVGLSQYPSNK